MAHRKLSRPGMLLAAALALGLAQPLALARPVLHVAAEPLSTSAYLIDWRPAGRVTFVDAQGRREGRYTTAGSQRVITLEAPLQFAYNAIDPDCPEAPQAFRVDVHQVGITRTAGTERRGESSLAQAGILHTLTGCNAGREQPWGSLSGPGLPTRHLDAALRPSIADLAPGVVIAGPSEDVTPGEMYPAADLMTVEPGAGRFAATGNAHPLSTVDGWLVLDLPGRQRAYTRVGVDRHGGESWLRADWSDGQPQTVAQAWMVKPEAGAGFGSLRQASRMWASGSTLGSTLTTFAIHLYPDGSGVRVAVDVPSGTENRQPITWAFDGNDIVQWRSSGGGIGERTWQPLRNSGTRRFLMETEVRRMPDGSVQPFIKPRVNFYVDTGPAVPPPAP